MYWKRYKTSLLIVAYFIFFYTSTNYAQDYDPPYPRIAQFTWGGARPEWYAKFDLLVIGHGNADRHAKAIKAINGRAIVQETSDWNKGNLLGDVPDKWKVRNSKGQFFNVWGSKKLIDYTDFCPTVNGLKPNTYLPQLAYEKVRNNPFLDGNGADGLWFEITNGDWLLKGDVDFDRNGVNDFQEHGKGWVRDKWTGSIIAMIARYREKVGNDKIIIINSGKFHTQAWEYHNGPILERSWAVKYGFDSFLKIYFDYIENARKPHTLLLDGHPSYSDLTPGNKFEKNLMMMRFLLCTTLLGDGFFAWSDTPGEHHYEQDFDEFRVDLGYPRQPAQELDDGVWVRFFDKGVSIVNGSGSTKTIADGDLSSLNGYAGPYYHFAGGQNPGLNSGRGFSSMRFWGESGGKAGSRHRMGDAVILLNEPNKAVIAEIIIDNIEPGTTEGSKSATFQGSWNAGTEVNANDPVSWHVGPHWIDSRYLSNPYHWVSSGSGGSKAKFVPTLGVSGSYHVYEWHGNTVENHASDVPYEIKHSEGTERGKIDQTRNFSKWNYLGKFKFDKGSGGYVEINNSANGSVVADAIKFVYGEGGQESADLTPPEPPVGVKAQ